MISELASLTEAGAVGESWCEDGSPGFGLDR